MDEIRELASQGWCLRELAAKYGCSRDCMMDRMKEADIPRLPQWSQPGSRNGQWTGGVQVDADGYILIHYPTHPYATSAGYVREHRLVMEHHLKRYLKPGEVVHHKNKDKANNSLANLELFASNADHLRSELTGQIPNWTEDGLRRIRQGVRRSLKNLRSANQKRSKNDVPS
jgi:hypothetical protein